MISSSSCCLNISPPPGQSSLPTNTIKIVKNWQKKKEISWKKKSVISVSCILIGLQFDNNIFLSDLVLAEELQADIIVQSKNGKPVMMRWSDKRSCSSWRLNSLETIVPENLPRPTARRRWEAVGFAGAIAPAVKDGIVSNSSNSGCFSM